MYKVIKYTFMAPVETIKSGFSTRAEAEKFIEDYESKYNRLDMYSSLSVEKEN